jgi:PAS domain-containing protein
MEKQSKKQPLVDLVETLKSIQGKEEMQDCMVKKFQELIRNKGESYAVINDFPYPMAIFEQDGDLVYVNRALSAITGLYTAELSLGKHSILNRITDANLPILDATENVFRSKTTFLTDLSDPLELFMSAGTNSRTSEYREAIFFPIREDEGKTTQGAVIFMKKSFRKKDDVQKPK